MGQSTVNLRVHSGASARVFVVVAFVFCGGVGRRVGHVWEYIPGFCLSTFDKAIEPYHDSYVGLCFLRGWGGKVGGSQLSTIVVGHGSVNWPKLKFIDGCTLTPRVALFVINMVEVSLFLNASKGCLNRMDISVASMNNRLLECRVHCFPFIIYQPQQLKVNRQQHDYHTLHAVV